MFTYQKLLDHFTSKGIESACNNCVSTGFVKRASWVEAGNPTHSPINSTRGTKKFKIAVKMEFERL